MNNEVKIISISTPHNPSKEDFKRLMNDTEVFMNTKSESYREISPSKFEDCAVEAIKAVCDGRLFNPDNIHLISGHKFPDIVDEKCFGVEVKSTISDSWLSTGSSIMESTRVKGVEDIYMLFGKLGGKCPMIKCRPYEEVMYDIAVTHSPRYLINMELAKDQTIFNKMGVSYNDFRNSDDSIAIVRNYYRILAEKNNKQELPWWITNANYEKEISFNVRLWSSLTPNEKKDLQAKCMILFPNALNPKRSQTKYSHPTLWLCSYNQVIHPNIRDMYSAGGKITHVDGTVLTHPVPQVFNIIVEFADTIKDILDNPSEDMLSLMKDYNPKLYSARDRYVKWLNVCCAFAKDYDVPLAEWVKEKPKFSFSKK